MSEEQTEYQEEQTEEQAAPSFADMLYVIVSDAIESEGIKQVYKELVMVTKDVEVLVEMQLADAYQTSRETDMLDKEEEIDVESSYAEETYSDEEEIVESLKEKIKRWFK